jgi:uncharacterized repeat protein (TIGR01451 family)
MRFLNLIPARLAMLATLVVTLAAALGATPALAEVPALTAAVTSNPTNLPRGGEGTLIVRVSNLGDAPTNGPIVIKDKLPAGLTAKAIAGPCVLATLRCEYGNPLSPYQEIEFEITVKALESAPATAVNEVSVSGGGAAGTVSQDKVVVSNTPASFGVENLRLVATNENGSIDTQAGSHPFELTTTLQMNAATGANSVRPGEDAMPEATKDLRFGLPAGLIGNPEVIPKCTSVEFDALMAEDWNACPSDTAIGVAQVYLTSVQYAPITVPLFNLVPSVGEPAKFGFEVFHVPIILDTSVRTGGDYGVVVSVNNISQVFPFFANQVTFWGVPQDPRHNAVRGWNCLSRTIYPEFAEFWPACVSPVNPKITPFLSLPTSCSGPAGMRTTVEADSWETQGVFKQGEYTPVEDGPLLGMDGCNRLPFAPSITVAPDGPAASTPTGLTVGVHVGQAGTLTPTGLAPADVKDTTVALPAGVQVSPAGADGLVSCSLGQIALEVNSVPTCPEGARVGTVEIKTPLLPQPLEGAAYLATQNANPFGSLLALYIVAEDPTAGIVVKFAGQVTLDPVTGQLVSTFKNTPALPFEELKLHFFGSARAPLTTPPLCGQYTTKASIAPWSGNDPVEATSTFAITSGPNGAPCSNPQPFTPDFQSGSLNLQAGAFTPFTLTMSRPDADQTLSRVEMQMPPGLLGTLSTVKLCPEPQASLGTCGEESLIGHTVVSAGLGNAPYTVTGGKIFITTGYKGGAYGLSIVNPAKAGPFDLGSVVVRASINVDVHTAALTIKSDPLPTIIQGIPLQIQHVNVTIDREKFTFNPTNCNKTAINGTLSSTEGAAAQVSTSFQVTNCAKLAFRPKLVASTSGKTSRASGASLHVRLTYPEGPYDANIARVKVSLPKQLPSRLTTLQKACAAATFEANPANCPVASIIGHATATTPVLPVPLTGPAYFVSHGGEAFPSLIIVLQGYGATVDLVGTTFINKAGITSSTFKTIPDVPVGTFELTLPQGKYSALAANGNLCKSKLAMPTAYVGQNGAVIHTSTPITPTGCPKHKAKKAKKASRHSQGKRKNTGGKKK